MLQVQEVQEVVAEVGQLLIGLVALQHLVKVMLVVTVLMMQQTSQVQVVVELELLVVMLLVVL